MENNEQGPDDIGISKISWGCLTKLLLVITFVVVAYGFIIVFFIEKPEDRAVFGDMFGAINALISGFAFAGVIYAILLQRSELELQRKELQLTRTELSRSAKAQEESEKALSAQAKQQALNMLPSITCMLESMDGNPFVNVSNTSNNIGFDVEVILFGVYDQDSIRKDDYINEFGRSGIFKSIGKPEITVNNEGFWCIYDIARFPIFPQKRKHRLNIGFKTLPGIIYLLIQFRDIEKNNYGQMYYFVATLNRNDRKNIRGYHLDSTDPIVPSPALRMTLSHDENKPFLIDENGSDKSIFIPDDFIQMVKSPTYLGTLDPLWRDTFGVGHWSDI